MQNQISYEQVEAIAAQCRKMRSEAVYDAFASLFKSMAGGIVSFFSAKEDSQTFLGLPGETRSGRSSCPQAHTLLPLLAVNTAVRVTSDPVPAVVEIAGGGLSSTPDTSLVDDPTPAVAG